MIKYLKTLFNPRPSLFDVCVAGFVFIPWIEGDHNRSLFIIFYSVLLLTLSFAMKTKREYKSLPLSLLALWAMLGLFIHSFALYPKSLTYQYKIYYLMTEGFLYILFGILFLRTVIKYSTNIRFIPFLIPISLIPWYQGLIYYGKSTPIVAIGLSIIIYLALMRNKFVIPAVIFGIDAIIYKWSWLSMKFRCRPYIWWQLLVNSFYHPLRRDTENIFDPGIEFSPYLDKFISGHPWLNHIKPWLQSVFGSGFSQYLNSDYTWVDTAPWNPKGYTFGWVHNQNDYLHIAKCLGPIGLALIIWFIVQSLKTIGMRPILILFMTVLLICFGQLTMFNPGMAGICLIITAVSITEGLRGKI